MTAIAYVRKTWVLDAPTIPPLEMQDGGIPWLTEASGNRSDGSLGSRCLWLGRARLSGRLISAGDRLEPRADRLLEPCHG